MTAITRTVNTLIKGAYKLIGVFSEERALEGFRITEALEYLQEILDHYASTDTRIAWDSLLNFNLTIDQQEYVFSKQIGADVDSNRIVNLKFITLTDGDFQYPVRVLDDEYYYRRRISLDKTGRPVEAFFQNSLDTTNSYEESRIFFFIKPDKAYQCTIKAKFILDAVSLSQPLDEVPNYMHRFLEYAVGRALQDHYPGSTWNQKKEEVYRELLTNIIDASDVNLVARVDGSLQQRNCRSSFQDFLNGN